MQNDTTPLPPVNPDQRVINYRPERPGVNFGITQSAQAVETAAPVAADVSMQPVVADVPMDETVSEKPFTLGNAIIIFIAIGVGVIGGFLAYATWIA